VVGGVLYGYNPFGGGLGIDLTDGDLVENIPGTDLGIDLETGEIELDLGFGDVPIF
jgi:hypothetical protein